MMEKRKAYQKGAAVGNKSPNTKEDAEETFISKKNGSRGRHYHNQLLITLHNPVYWLVPWIRKKLGLKTPERRT